MTLSYTYDGTAFPVNVAPSAINIPTRADDGEAAMGGIPVEDSTGALAIVGHRPFTVLESACSQPRLWSGWTQERGIGRSTDRGLFVGDDARIHDMNVIEYNACFNMLQIAGTATGAGIRPAETWGERLAWIVGSEYLSPFVSDTGYVASAAALGTFYPARPMDAADYTGQYPSAVLDDLATRLEGFYFTYFAFYDAAATAYGLFFNPDTESIGTATLTISNDPDDVSATCFAPDAVARLNREPDQVYSEVEVLYSHGTKRLFRSRASTASTYIQRGTTIERPFTGGAATASKQAEAFLDRHSVELDRITCTITVPAASAGLVRSGQHMAVKFTHLPGYETSTTMRVVGVTPTPTDDTAAYYEIALELVALWGNESPYSAPGVFQHAITGDVLNQNYEVVLPNELGAGDVLVAFFMSSNSEVEDNLPTSIEGADWTLRVSGYGYSIDQYGGPGNAATCAVYTRTVLAGDSKSITVTPGNGRTITAIFELVGVSEADIVAGEASGITIGMGTIGAVSATTSEDAFAIGGWVHQRTSYAPPDAVTGTGDETYNGAPLTLGILGFDTGPSGVGDPHMFITTTQATNPSIGGNIEENAYLNQWGWYAFIVAFTGLTVADTETELPPTPGSVIESTSDPTVDDDSDDGYQVGQIWVNTSSGYTFVLVDGTVGAAVWTLITTGAATSFAVSDGVTTVDPTVQVTFVGPTLADLGSGVAELTFDYAPSTVDYLVGSASGDLSAEIVVGTTPGGELGGTWASPTVDATHAGSTHLALGTTSSTAAAGDHVHGSSSGELLITDTPAGSPLIFDDILQNEAGTDLLYSD